MYCHVNAANVYYCPKCDRTILKDRLEKIDSELRTKFGNTSLSSMSCPVCGMQLIDLDSVKPGGAKHVGEAKH